MMALSEINGDCMGYRSIPASELGENLARAEMCCSEYGRLKENWVNLIISSLFVIPYILFCYA